MSSLSLFMKERLEFDNPKTMGEVIQKACLCYQQNRQKEDGGKRWTDKKGIKFTSCNKGNKIVFNKGPHKSQPIRNVNRNQPKFKFPSESKTNKQFGKPEVERAARPPI